MTNDVFLTPHRAQLAAEQGSLPLPPSPGPSPSPLRRSPRFSSPLPVVIPQPAAEIEEHVEDENLQSRPVTPENEQASDEPSSVLASRIMRSHTNPSPPPQSPDEAEKPLVFFPNIDPPSMPGLDNEMDTPSMGASPAPEIKIHQPVPLRYPQRALSPMQDANTSVPSLLPSRESSFCFTVEEPSQSPDPAIIPLPPSPSTTPMLTDANLREEPNTTDEEADVADSLIPTEMESPMPSSSRFTLATEDPHTPVRRSSRPRKSLLDSPLATISPLKNKGKGKADVDPSETTPRPKFEIPRREMSPLRAQLKESARTPRRPLNSLSPGTVGLLGTLVPSKTPSPLPEVNEREPSLPLPFRFPKPDPTPANAASLPFRPPNRLPSPRRDHPASPMASPMRSLLRDGSQSPLRRIPIEEAIANLRSPSKTPGGQSFKLKIRPTDSPARRGPPPTADSMTTPRPSKLSLFDKPSSSPTRSRSMEPSPTARTRLVVRSGSAEPSIPSLPFPLLPARSQMPTTIPEDAEVSTPILPEASSSNPPLQPQPQKSVLRQHTPSKIPRLKPYARPASSINVNKSRLPMRQVDFSTAPKSTGGKPVAKLKATVEISLKRKRSTAEEPSQSPLKIPNLRPVPNISSPPKPLPARLDSPPTADDSTEMSTFAESSAPSASLLTEPPLPELRASTAESSIPQPSESLSAVRRTTRTRRAITPSTDLFPKPAIVLPPPRQRKPPAIRSEINLFRGLTPAAWTSMTKSNTVKNEAYQTAKLAIEVVRKEGIRPDSPILKVKTKSQKEQDERGRQRSQRAERRAQRLAGGSSTDGRNSASLEESSLDDDWDVDVEGSPLRHRRGPGDEEDYVTPDRPPPSKKARFDGDGEEKEGKSVKWDRGLQTTLFMDEIKFRDKLPKENTTNVKGILAPAAKSLTLDKLGNLVTESSSPLKDLVPENIIVKKIVYDSDFPSPPVVEPARNTRSRTKKKS